MWSYWDFTVVAELKVSEWDYPAASNITAKVLITMRQDSQSVAGNVMMEARSCDARKGLTTRIASSS